MDDMDIADAAAVASYDQIHADAIALLSSARAFLLVVEEGDGGLALTAATLDRAAGAFLASAAGVAAIMTRQSIDDVAAHPADEDEED